MRNASTVLLEQETQTPSPAPDLIPAETENQPRTHIGIGIANGGTSVSHHIGLKEPTLSSVPSVPSLFFGTQEAKRWMCALSG
jgi:hypothetical protein